MKTSKILSVLLSVLTALVVLTGSIAVPLLCRSFYYAHIGPMHLENYGLTEREIKTAYDEMMDFCLGKREDFSAGVLAFSRSGADHFADVRGLFLLDLRVLLAALACVLVMGALLVILLVLRREDRVRWRGPLWAWWAIVAGSGVLFFIPGIVSTALEVFFTISATLLTRRVYLRRLERT